jgi:hypothetical protein
VQITTDKDELRRALAERQVSHVRCRSFHTGLKALDEIAPKAAFQGGAVHELLWPRQSTYPKSLALLLAKAAQKNGGAIAWSDPERELHLPALSAAGINLRNLVLLRCANRADQLWALAECLRCRGVGATVAFIQRLSQIEARRLQLAAERGGGVGLFMRPDAPGISNTYAAATRWLSPSTNTVHTITDVPSNGMKVPSRCLKYLTIAILMTSSTPISIPSTIWTTVRAGNSTW